MMSEMPESAAHRSDMVSSSSDCCDLRLGLDIGSTTVKAVVASPQGAPALFSRYVRHHAKLRETTLSLLEEVADAYPSARFRIGVCGSGGRPIAHALGAGYVQEVVANTVALRTLHPSVRCAIELGGQDAKVVFFRKDEATGSLVATDMRMNGSCAGGTGAFLDEVASLLGVQADELGTLADKGQALFEISGRCGVFAKTDIQPLLMQGAKPQDIAISSFHAIAKQTIGGLAQGLELTPPIAFEGGPLTYNPALVRVFSKRLGLQDCDIILPLHAETTVAHGAALAVDELYPLAAGTDDRMSAREAIEKLRSADSAVEAAESKSISPLFETDEQHTAFTNRHDAQLRSIAEAHPDADGTVHAFLGIDSGSTTSKFALLDEDCRVINTFYGHNKGDALHLIANALTALNEKYEACGMHVHICGLCTTGYGEQLFARAFGADCHTVETVAHAAGCTKFIPDASFILDIGGQDMKAMWLDGGVITDIMLNEACSSGCGSFLENFAESLDVSTEDIADAAFQSHNPADLGSRCTVFMNSTIINEQRNGKGKNDILAGLCRSIVQNVFTKVVRINDASVLGEKIVVQGGTFRNRAVLRALEEYLCTDVVLAPYPGEMGAIGAALIAMRQCADTKSAPGGYHVSSFIGFDALLHFDFTQKDSVRCAGCGNHCARSITTFSTGAVWITGNRCERGGADELMQAASKAPTQTEPERPIPPTDQPRKQDRKAVDLFALRRTLLFKEYAFTPCAPEKDQVIGLPRVLEFYNSMPFWSTFFHALGYQTVYSHESSHELYEQGIRYVASDTVCLPAKLVHGHIQDLAEQGVDRIFMPYIMHMPPEGSDDTSPYVCSIVMGYPMVVHIFQSPETHTGIEFDTPVFHWFSNKNRHDQIVSYASDTLGVTRKQAEGAFSQAQGALESFRHTMTFRGRRVLDDIHQHGGKAVVLAARPYQSDPFVSHGISQMFSSRGIPVLTLDSLPDLNTAPLSNIRAEITNNFHTRMIEGAVLVASDPALEYAQIVSFGCGHDAILTDEIARVLQEGGDKSPLVLKVDESDASGSLGIRIRSFIETMRARSAASEERGAGRAAPDSSDVRISSEAIPQSCDSHVSKWTTPYTSDTHDVDRATLLPDPYPAKFLPADKQTRTLLIPNISKEVSRLFGGLLTEEGFRVQTVAVGGMEQIRTGKRYTHNDICFPCQMVIGELIDALQKGDFDPATTAVGMVKFQCDCRMSHYAALLRRALDNAGLSEVPVLTTDATDSKNMHPGVMLLGIGAVVKAIWAFTILDLLNELKRKIRPYEINVDETNRVFDKAVGAIADAAAGGLPKMIAAFKNSIATMSRIPYDRSHPKPIVVVSGELLVTYHPGSNYDIENYLEKNGMETAFPRITDQLRKDFAAAQSEIKDFKGDMTRESFLIGSLFDLAQTKMERIARAHPLHENGMRPNALYAQVSDFMPKTLSCGEGWLMAAEIVRFAKRGVRSFVILQPFGCLPNHICGRGVTKRIKDEFPGIQILPLDLDPDTSYANVENRLQMLIMNDRDIRMNEQDCAVGSRGLHPQDKRFAAV